MRFHRSEWPSVGVHSYDVSQIPSQKTSVSPYLSKFVNRVSASHIFAVFYLKVLSVGLSVPVCLSIFACLCLCLIIGDHFLFSSCNANT